MEKCDGTRNTSIIPFDENGREKWSDKRKPHKSLLYGENSEMCSNLGEVQGMAVVCSMADKVH